MDKHSPVEKKVEVPIAPMRRVFFGLIKYDLEYITLDELEFKIHNQSHVSVLYFVLLITSVLVCTLGLLTNSTAVVIGGMLIAPLTWPLARVGYGIARRAPHHLYRGLLLVTASILIGALVAFIITTISPIKILNEEILQRTSPTLMDLFIALAAGIVAATAITQRKIADSLAGVAIAVSLMPPLCTVGITLGLRQYDFAGGALLLFVVNAACITLITALIIAYNTYLRTRRFKIALRATLINLLIVLLLSIPLGYYLNRSSDAIRMYDAVNSQMKQFVAGKDQSATFENIKVDNVDDASVSVYADLLIPNDSAFTYEDNESLIARLEQAVGKKVLLNLRIQTIIEPISKDQQENEARINLLNTLLTANLSKIDESFKISSVSVVQKQDTDVWVITAEIFSDPDTVPTSTDLSNLDEQISEQSASDIELNLTFVPQLTLRSSDQSKTQESRDVIQNVTRQIDQGAEVSLFTLNLTQPQASVSYTVTTPDISLLDEAYVDAVKQELSSVLSRDVSVRVRLVQATEIIR